MEYRGSRCLQGLLSACLSLVLVGVLWLVIIEPSLATHAEASQAGKGHSVPGRSQAGGSIGCDASLVASLSQALSRGVPEQIEQVLTGIMQCRELSSDALLSAGTELMQRELYPQASRVLSRCVQDHPGLFECHYNLALTEFALQRPNDAMVALQGAAPELKQQELARHYLRGKIREALSQPREAEQDLWTAFSGQPSNENYALDLGVFCLRQRDYTRAVAVFQRGMYYHRHSSFLRLGIALAQFLGGREAASVETCRELLALQPNFSSARLLMAFGLYLGGRYAEAEEVAAAGLRDEQSPQPYLNYVHAALLLKLQSREYNRMLQELALSRGAIPNCSLCYFTESKVYQALGNSQAAIADLEKAVAQNPKFSEAWYRLGGLYDRLGRAEDARKAFSAFREVKAEKSSDETKLIHDLFVPNLGKPDQAGALR
jgi:tetratricopeptide (TPR) repeat protein